MLLPLGLFFWVLTGYTVERKRQRTRARRARAHVRERERWGGGMGGGEREKRQKKISKFLFFSPLRAFFSPRDPINYVYSLTNQ